MTPIVRTHMSVTLQLEHHDGYQPAEGQVCRELAVLFADAGELDDFEYRVTAIFPAPHVALDGTVGT